MYKSYLMQLKSAIQIQLRLHNQAECIFHWISCDSSLCLYPTGPGNSSQQRFFSSALRFLRGALQAVEGKGQAQVSPVWAPWWEEVCELWRLSLQALGGCVNAQPWIATIIREEGWLQNILSLLESSCRLPDTHSQEALEEALCALAQKCPLCRQDISVYLKREAGDSLHCMPQLRKFVTS